MSATLVSFRKVQFHNDYSTHPISNLYLTKINDDHLSYPLQPKNSENAILDIFGTWLLSAYITNFNVFCLIKIENSENSIKHYLPQMKSSDKKLHLKH